LLELVGLQTDMLPQYPHEFSGGERQRIGIARALTLGPRFIVADEPVTALDVSVQGQIMNLLVDLQREFGLTYLLIAHDVGLVCSVATRVAVMYLGRIVEIAPAGPLYESPLHPYTRTLLTSLPHRRTGNGSDTGESHPSGEPGDPAGPPQGCVFEPRCPHAMDRCRENVPELREVKQDRFVACYLW
jgi:oligopeptide/dipeptide ABC transporter ATP-binding protein